MNGIRHFENSLKDGKKTALGTDGTVGGAAADVGAVLASAPSPRRWVPDVGK